MKKTNHDDSKSVMTTIERFREFLNSVWPVISLTLEGHDWDEDAYFLEDWLDANWYFFVTRELLGKDGNLQPFAVATNDVLKRRFTHWFESVEERKIFMALGTVRETFEIAPPFDMMKVLGQDGSIEIVPWLSLNFEIRDNGAEKGTEGIK